MAQKYMRKVLEEIHGVTTFRQEALLCLFSSEQPLMMLLKLLLSKPPPIVLGSWEQTLTRNPPGRSGSGRSPSRERWCCHCSHPLNIHPLGSSRDANYISIEPWTDSFVCSPPTYRWRGHYSERCIYIWPKACGKSLVQGK